MKKSVVRESGQVELGASLVALTSPNSFGVGLSSETSPLLKGEGTGDYASRFDGEWISAKDLKAGDVSLTAGGKRLLIASITPSSQSETVYNFSVADNHTYYVGDSGVLVHNESYLAEPDATGKETVAKLVERYNREHGTTYSIADIAIANGFYIAPTQDLGATPVPRPPGVDASWGPPPSGWDLGRGESINMPVQNPFVEAYNSLKRNPLNSLLNYANDALMVGVSKLNFLGKAFKGRENAFKWTDDWNNETNPWYETIGKGLIRSVVGTLGYPVAAALHVAGNTALMVGGTLLQASSPIDYTWGAFGTYPGLIYGLGQIIRGNTVKVERGVAIFENSNLVPKGTGVSLGPILSGAPGFTNWGHEFGHTQQNRALGPGYLGIMIDSAMSVSEEKKQYAAYKAGTIPSWHDHHFYRTETWADKWGIYEYNQRDPKNFGWNSRYEK